MIKLFEKLNNKKGMTLIEVTVAFAIVAVISVVMVIGFKTIGNVSQEGRNISDLSQQLERQVAMSKSSKAEASSISLTGATRSTIKINGEVNEYTLEEDGTTKTFRMFEAETEKMTTSRKVAEATKSMLVKEGIDLNTASHGSFYDNDNANTGKLIPQRISTVAGLAGVSSDSIGFSYTAGEWYDNAARRKEVIIHFTNDVSGRASIKMPGDVRLWNTTQSSGSAHIYICVLVGNDDYYKLQIK